MSGASLDTKIWSPCRSLGETFLTPLHLAELTTIKETKDLPHNIVVKLMADICDVKYDSAEDLIKERRYRETVRDPERIRVEVEKAIDENPKAFRRHLAGSVAGFSDLYGEYLAPLRSAARFQPKLPSPGLPTHLSYPPTTKTRPSTKPWGRQFRLKPR